MNRAGLSTGSKYDSRKSGISALLGPRIITLRFRYGGEIAAYPFPGAPQSMVQPTKRTRRSGGLLHWGCINFSEQTRFHVQDKAPHWNILRDPRM